MRGRFIIPVTLGAKSLFGSWRSFILAIAAPPLIIALAVAAIWPIVSGLESVSRLRVAFVDMGSDGASYFDTVISLAAGDESFGKNVLISEMDYEGAMAALAAGEADAVTVFPEGFVTEMAAGVNKPIRLILSDADPIKSAYAKELMAGAAAQLSAAQTGINTVWKYERGASLGAADSDSDGGDDGDGDDRGGGDEGSDGGGDASAGSGAFSLVGGRFGALVIDYAGKVLARDRYTRDIVAPSDATDAGVSAYAAYLAVFSFFGGAMAARYAAGKTSDGIFGRVVSGGVGFVRVFFYQYIPMFAVAFAATLASAVVALAAVWAVAGLFAGDAAAAQVGVSVSFGGFASLAVIMAAFCALSSAFAALLSRVLRRARAVESVFAILGAFMTVASGALIPAQYLPSFLRSVGSFTYIKLARDAFLAALTPGASGLSGAAAGGFADGFMGGFIGGYGGAAAAAILLAAAMVAATLLLGSAKRDFLRGSAKRDFRGEGAARRDASGTARRGPASHGDLLRANSRDVAKTDARAASQTASRASARGGLLGETAARRAASKTAPRFAALRSRAPLLTRSRVALFAAIRIKAMLSDRASVAALLAAPLAAVLCLWGLAAFYAGGATRIPVIVANLDGGEFSELAIERLAANRSLIVERSEQTEPESSASSALALPLSPAMSARATALSSASSARALPLSQASAAVSSREADRSVDAARAEISDRVAAGEFEAGLLILPGFTENIMASRPDGVVEVTASRAGLTRGLVKELFAAQISRLYVACDAANRVASGVKSVMGAGGRAGRDQLWSEVFSVADGYWANGPLLSMNPENASAVLSGTASASALSETPSDTLSETLSSAPSETLSSAPSGILSDTSSAGDGETGRAPVSGAIEAINAMITSMIAIVFFAYAAACQLTYAGALVSDAENGALDRLSTSPGARKLWIAVSAAVPVLIHGAPCAAALLILFGGSRGAPPLLTLGFAVALPIYAFVGSAAAAAIRDHARYRAFCGVSLIFGVSAAALAVISGSL